MSQAPFIMIAGSRYWSDWLAVERAMVRAWKHLERPPLVGVLTGRQTLRSADHIVAALANSDRLPWSVYDASVPGVPPSATTECMLGLNPVLCLAFIGNVAPFAKARAAAAEAAGIPTWRYYP